VWLCSDLDNVSEPTSFDTVLGLRLHVVVYGQHRTQTP
jgi:hypothetical protein